MQDLSFQAADRLVQLCQLLLNAQRASHRRINADLCTMIGGAESRIQLANFPVKLTDQPARVLIGTAQLQFAVKLAGKFIDLVRDLTESR